MRPEEDQRLEIGMGHMLRIGMMLAALIVPAGGPLYLEQVNGPIPDYKTFRNIPVLYRSIEGLFSDIRCLDSKGVIDVGILLLIATPICRVIVGIVGLSLKGDHFYIGVVSIVLLILLASLFMGR